MAGKESAEASPTASLRPATGPIVKFDDSGITNVYTNVCNVSNSREEVVLVFDMNNA